MEGGRKDGKVEKVTWGKVQGAPVVLGHSGMTVLVGAGWPRFAWGSLEGVDTCTSQGVLGPLRGLGEKVGSQDRAEGTEQMQTRLRKGERRGQGPRRQGTWGNLADWHCIGLMLMALLHWFHLAGCLVIQGVSWGGQEVEVRGWNAGAGVWKSCRNGDAKAWQ